MSRSAHPVSRALAGLVMLLALCGCQPQSTLATGSVVPDFSLPQLEGGRFGSADLAGGTTPVVLNFWATWCGPCIREIPALKALHASGAVRVIAIAVDEPAELVRPFVAEHAMTYPVLLGDATTFSRFQGRAIPYTVILDADLVVRKVHVGLVSQHQLERDLAAARTPMPAATS